MQKVIISGGPGTGKSTTMEALRDIYTDAYFVPEAAEQVIKEQLEIQKENPEYIPIMPTTHYGAFFSLVVDRQRENEAKIPENADLVLLDRSFVDNLGYLAFNGLGHLGSEVVPEIESARYSYVFFCAWLVERNYIQSTIRRESPDEGLAIHRHLKRAYTSTDLPVQRLAPVSVDERLAIIRGQIDNLLNGK